MEELVETVAVFPDHLEVTVTGAPPLNVLYQEVGLRESGFVGVGGAYLNLPTPCGHQPLKSDLAPGRGAACRRICLLGRPTS